MLLRNPTSAVALEVGERVRTAVGRARPAARSASRASASRSAWRSPSRRTSRSATSSRRPTAPCIEPSAPGAIGSSPPDGLPSAPMTDDAPDDAPDLTNGDLARIFHEIGDILELKGELVFKTVAYHRAADAIGRSPVDVVAAYRSGTRAADPGCRQGHQRQARRSWPRPVTSPTTSGSGRRCRRRSSSCCEIGGLGPKTVRQLNQELGIETVDDLRKAAESGRLRTLRGMSARTEALVLEGIAKLDDRFDRMRLDRAEELLTALIDGLSGTPGVASIEPAGSFRRRQGDRSATWTCSPRPTSRRRSSTRSPASAWSIRSSTGAATRRPSGCCAGRRRT